MKILERLNNTELELSGLNRWLGKKTFRRTTFYESLAGMIRDGTPVMRALEFICDVETDFGKKKGQSGLYFLATDCIASIRSSGQLSPALKDWVPKDEIALIRNGEERGDIAEAMFQVVKTAKGRQEMISSLVSVCLYMSTREFEAFEAGRRYANTAYLVDLQEMQGDNLLRELVRITAQMNWQLNDLKEQIRQGNVISGQQLALTARQYYEKQLGSLEKTINQANAR